MEGQIKSFLYPVMIAVLAYFIKYEFELLNKKVDDLTTAVQDIRIDNVRLRTEVDAIKKQHEQEQSKQFYEPDPAILPKEERIKKRL